MTGLLDKVVMVTGAARGTGRVHCQRFAEEGTDVIALDAPAVADDLRGTARDVASRNRHCALGVADVSDLDAMTDAVNAGVAELGRLDVIVANAGIHLPGAPAWELDPLDWQRTLDINLTGGLAHDQGGRAARRGPGRCHRDHQFHQRTSRDVQHRALHRE